MFSLNKEADLKNCYKEMDCSGNTCVCITNKSIILSHHMCITTIANWEFTCFILILNPFSTVKIFVPSLISVSG